MIRGTKRSIAVACAATLLAVTTLLGAAGPAAAVSTCKFAAGPDRFLWTGGAHDNKWSSAANWNQNKVPGASSHVPTNDVACIPTGVTVTLGQGEGARLRAVDIDGKLVVGDAVNGGGALVLDGGANNTPSTIDDIDVLASTLGGRGTVTVTGTITMRSLPPFATHMTTREVNFRPPVGSDPFVNAGVTIIAHGATMAIDGTDPNCFQTFCGGLGLEDQRVIENHGVTVLSNQGFIAADDGTTFLNSPDGEFRIANDAGFYQGFILDVLARPVFTNAGLLHKSAGSGTSVVDADYRPSDGTTTGTVVVDSGALSIFSDDGVATVQPGATFGTGACGTENSQCTTPFASPTDIEAFSVQLSALNTAPAPVTIDEQGRDPLTYTSFKTKGDQVRVVVDPAGVSTQRPALVKLIMDKSIFAAGTKVTEIRIGRNGTVIPFCTSGQIPCVVSITAGQGNDIVALVKTNLSDTVATPLGPGFRG